MTDYRKALDALRGGGVRFIVIGGVAGIAHGSTHMTNDLDVVYARGTEDIARLATALARIILISGVSRRGCPSSSTRRRFSTA
jgi:hypothetical protein